MRIALLFLAGAGSLLGQSHPTLDFQTNAGPLRLTAIRHASLMLEAGGQVIHVDPWSQGSYAGLAAADLILITDTHGDHLDLKALAQVRREKTVVVAPAAAAAQIDGARAMKNGETLRVGPFEIEALPMYNVKRGPAEGKVFHEKGRGNGYVVSYGGFRLYIAGDTEPIPEMQGLKNIDAALLPMNLPYTMTPEEAAGAVRMFRPKLAIPYHYRGADLSGFEKALAGSGIAVKLLDWYH